MSPKILLEKNKERENRVSEGKGRRRGKKSNGCTASFLFLDLRLRGEPILAVTLFKNPALRYIFLTLVPNR